jgi:hypothetical protein
MLILVQDLVEPVGNETHGEHQREKDEEVNRLDGSEEMRAIFGVFVVMSLFDTLVIWILCDICVLDNTQHDIKDQDYHIEYCKLLLLLIKFLLGKHQPTQIGPGLKFDEMNVHAPVKDLGNEYDLVQASGSAKHHEREYGIAFFHSVQEEDIWVGENLRDCWDDENHAQSK